MSKGMDGARLNPQDRLSIQLGGLLQSRFMPFPSSNTSGTAYMSAAPAYNATRPEAHNHTKAHGLKMTNRAQDNT
jgi:hypothetical protein